MDDQRNTFIALILMIVILFGWQMFFAHKHAPKPQDTTQPGAPPSTAPPAIANSDASVPAGGDSSPSIPAPVAGPRLKVRTAHLHGEIALTGLRFDDITLATYHDTPDPSSPEITLLSPTSAPKPYYAEEGWIAGDAATK